MSISTNYSKTNPAQSDINTNSQVQSDKQKKDLADLSYKLSMFLSAAALSEFAEAGVSHLRNSANAHLPVLGTLAAISAVALPTLGNIVASEDKDSNVAEEDKQKPSNIRLKLIFGVAMATLMTAVPSAFQFMAIGVNKLFGTCENNNFDYCTYNYDRGMDMAIASAVLLATGVGVTAAFNLKDRVTKHDAKSV